MASNDIDPVSTLAAQLGVDATALKSLVGLLKPLPPTVAADSSAQAATDVSGDRINSTGPAADSTTIKAPTGRSRTASASATRTARGPTKVLPATKPLNDAPVQLPSPPEMSALEQLNKCKSLIGGGEKRSASAGRIAMPPPPTLLSTIARVPNIPHTNASKLRAEQAKYDEVCKALALAQGEIATRDSMISSMGRDLDERARVIDGQRLQLDEKEVAIGELHEQLGKHEDKLHNLTGQLNSLVRKNEEQARLLGRAQEVEKEVMATTRRRGRSRVQGGGGVQAETHYAGELDPEEKD